ncbi:hypothetical protein L484_000345 [Morus notabilis]|uniref:Uncharacterized protein n=1 Tax=Morus notabilis TaxID=981085 RepID=W9SDX4_9ROSA|nr:hypothetical protein L484_000345 [Morus notabilis]
MQSSGYGYQCKISLADFHTRIMHSNYTHVATRQTTLKKSYRPTEGEKLNVVQLLDNETSLDECANWDLMGNHLAAKEPKHIRAMYRNM